MTLEFAKLQAWCDDTRFNTQKAIEEAAAQIEQLTADIAKAEQNKANIQTQQSTTKNKQMHTHIYIYIYIYIYNNIAKAEADAEELAGEIEELEGARKGTNGVSTIGVTANLMFSDRGTFWVLPLTYFYPPGNARAYLFPQSVKIHYFCSGPVSVDPTCPQPRRHRGQREGGRRGDQDPRQGTSIIIYYSLY